MKYCNLWTLAAIGVMVYAFVPMELMATTSKFGAKELGDHANDIKDFLFGAPIKIAAALGFAYGMIQCYTSGSATPLYTYGGLGLAGFAAPTVIEKLTPIAGMLIP